MLEEQEKRLADALAEAELARSSHAVVTEALRQERAEVERLRAIALHRWDKLSEAKQKLAEAQQREAALLARIAELEK